jgi:hypothetical protein
MLKHLQLQRPESPDAYERAFVNTVLRLQGVTDAPTEPQYADALRTFQQYRISVARMRQRDLAVDDGWLKGRLPEPAAVEHAFLFVRFDSVLLPNAGQLKALNEWLAAARLH